MRRTKIVATAGPAWDRPGVLDAMIASGVDVVRLNASHSPREELERRLADVRAAAARAGRHVGVLVDLGGPKIRIGEMAEGTILLAGSAFTLDADPAVGDERRASVSYAGLSGDVSCGDRLLLDDGSIELRVTVTDGDRIETEVVFGGPLSSRKGVNVPGVRLGVEAVTPKDREDAAWASQAGVDWLAQSFVRGPEDVAELRDTMGAGAVPIVAKVEKHEALESLEAIVEVADAVMVARGDLGVETSPEQVPVVQRRLVGLCRIAGKPVIVATQMLDSMRSMPRPTRAEASDVATAVFEGADAVMLSAESAVGDFPVQAAETMARIAQYAEAAGGGASAAPRADEGADVTRAVSAAACELASDLGAAAIVTATESGATARAVAAHRPGMPVIAVTSDARVAERLTLVWGVTPEIVLPFATVEEMALAAVACGQRLAAARPGDRVILTAGVAVNRPGTTDMVRVLTL